MGRVFGMTTGVVHGEGVKVSDYAQDFGASRAKVREIVKEILASDYASDEARAIAREVMAGDAALGAVQEKLDAHGEFGKFASNRTEAAQSEVLRSINTNRNMLDVK